MPSLLGTYVAANYLKEQGPYSNFGTRDLRFVKVVLSGTGAPNLTKGADGATGVFTDAGSYFSLAVRAAQTGAEIYFVGQPDATSFIIAVSSQTVNDSDAGNIEGGNYGDLEGYIAAAMPASTTVTITAIAAVGSTIA